MKLTKGAYTDRQLTFMRHNYSRLITNIPHEVIFFNFTIIPFSTGEFYFRLSASVKKLIVARQVSYMFPIFSAWDTAFPFRICKTEFFCEYSSVSSEYSKIKNEYYMDRRQALRFVPYHRYS